ncbi:MAG: 30S ribosomal protein S7 [Candidatus Saliniplasma sp.]
MSKEVDGTEEDVLTKKQRLFDNLEMPLLFDKYDMKDVEVDDPGLKKYINLLPILVPHSGGTHSNERFGTQEVSIIEKLINSLMRRQEYTGKKAKCYNSIKEAMDIIHEKTDKNPVQVLVDAIENSAPKEETTQITYGGISVPKAVDVSPIRRLSIAVGNNTKGAVKASYKNKKDIAECLAEELMKAANKDRNSYAVSKKEEIERMAQSAR